MPLYLPLILARRARRCSLCLALRSMPSQDWTAIPGDTTPPEPTLSRPSVTMKRPFKGM